MLGVADLKTPEAVAAAESAISTCQPVISLAADGSEIDSEDSGADDDSEDDENESGDNSCKDGIDVENGNGSVIKESISGKDNIHEKQKGAGNSKKRPRIVELS